MAEPLRFKMGSKVDSAEGLYEGYAVSDNAIIANVSIEKIDAVMKSFILMHNEPVFFILELPANVKDETETADGVVEKLHKDVYYIDGCKPEEALMILRIVGELLYNDGISSFGFGCHNSGDEIMFGKYNVLTIYSKNIGSYSGFFAPHKIEPAEKFITAWDIISPENPGHCGRYELYGKTVFDIPGMLRDWGIYLAEQREE
jgi:hypothetical protein